MREEDAFVGNVILGGGELGQVRLAIVNPQEDGAGGTVENVRCEAARNV